ncbi:MAG: Pycsar system effector family protein [Ilumatobacter sp.]
MSTGEQNTAIDYMLRTTQQHHVQLSVMADQKANIMIASTSILLTFSFANFKQQNLFWGFLALFVFAFIALVLAILAVMPRLHRHQSGSMNPLFFGDFNQLNLDEYRSVMSDVMETEATTYDALVADIHALGTTLSDRKYRFLTLSYRVFLTGILTAGALFVLQTALFYFT